MKHYAWCSLLAVGFGVVSFFPAGRAAENVNAPLPERIDFNRDIRPILSENCFRCHGFDDKARKARLRLDTFEGATNVRKGRAAVVPGDLEKSELIKRILAEDVDEKMPPAETGKKLTERDIALLKRWIEQKAEYAGHWAFLPVMRPEAPQVKEAGWAKNQIDYFVLARLERDGLKPRAEANRETLIRRVTFDLTGLPPTPEEIDAFLKDESADAYEKVVDRLIASPRYGERMALEWLDASRFADTHGYHIDSGRDMTRWREWVINAFNNNKRFNEFTVEQLAGDMLPNASVEQRIASGFNRNHMINYEGGAIPEEYHTAYIMDRVNTTGTVWLGLTVGCAQCHDHKYDPITMKDYYGLYALFNNVPENGLDGRKGNAVPMLKTPTPPQQKKLDEYAAQMKELDEALYGPAPDADSAQEKWEALALAESNVQWAMLDALDFESAGGAILSKRGDGAIFASGNNPPTDTYTIKVETDLPEITAVRLEALPHEGLVAKGPGRSDNGNAVLSEVRVNDAEGKPIKVKAATAGFSQEKFPVAGAIDGKKDTAWAIFPEVGKPHKAVFEFEKPIKTNGRTRLTVALDFQSQFPQHQFAVIRLSATAAKYPHGPKIKIPPNVLASLAVATDKRNEQQANEVKRYYRSTISPELKELKDQIEKVKKSQKEYDDTVETVMVMQEMSKPRETFMLVRGQYDKKGDKVVAAVPGFLPQLPDGTTANRLTFAQWLVSGNHPLTARVIVNRYWQMYFGTGLVKTSEDFGAQGEWPSHPELLDWLASEFVKSGWDIKAMQRLIVTSATYRQSSVVSKELVARDPENRLLARGSRFRLQAEFIRDQALAISGLLNGDIGGNSVSPYQPVGIWEELAYRSDGDNFSAQKYDQSKGKDLYRRTMYTFWKRTAPPPTLSTFDAPDRETCTVRRGRTNTPLQALILMNDPTYVEASRKLAERMMSEGGSTAEQRIGFAFRLATGRKAVEREIGVLKKVFEEQHAAYQKDTAAAKKVLSVGEARRNEKLDAAELASWSMVASVILNLDETVTKN